MRLPAGEKRSFSTRDALSLFGKSTSIPDRSRIVKMVKKFSATNRPPARVRTGPSRSTLVEPLLRPLPRFR